MADGNGLHIPRWALVAGALLVGIVSATWGAASSVAKAKAEAEALQTEVDLFHLRLCRIERAVGLEPWPTCPAQITP